MKHDNGFRTVLGCAVVVVTPLVAVATWIIVTRAGTQSLIADAGGQLTSIGPVSVVTVAALTATLGMLSLAWLDRRFGRGRLIWGLTACGILVISFAGALSGVAPHDRVGLLALHVVTGILVILGGLLATRSVDSPTTAHDRAWVEAGTRGR